MTDNERRVRAAELMGWTNIRCERTDVMKYLNYGEPILIGDYVVDGATTVTKPIRDYPHDMNAAMEVIAATSNIRWAMHQLDDGKTWTAYTMKQEGRGWKNVSDAQDELLSRAITDAFIKAMCNQNGE